VPLPIRIAVRVDFDDGSQHEYEVRGSDAVTALPGFWPEGVVTADVARRMEHDRARQEEIASLKRDLAGVAQERSGFLKDCRIDTSRNIAETSVRITHLPTGVQCDGATVDEAAGKLSQTLVQRGDISVNDARAAMGLPEFREDFANERLRML
jgi:hypothetical protein